MQQYSEASVTSNKIKISHRRDVIKNIFFSFVITLPIFSFIFSIFSKKKSIGKPSHKELYRSHKLAG